MAFGICHPVLAGAVADLGPQVCSDYRRFLSQLLRELAEWPFLGRILSLLLVDGINVTKMYRFYKGP